MAKTLTVSLKRDGATLRAIDMEKGCEPVFAGRSHTCALQSPPDDKSVSGRHARLFWKGSSLWIEDCNSRNGIHFDGARLEKPVKTVPYGVYSIGSCQIVVSEKERTAKKSSEPHRLEFMNGDRKHEIVDLSPAKGGTFTIGLDPASGLHLDDILVSRRHAKIRVAEDGCYISDLGSRNGTWVNGERLGTKERLLRDGDRISIVYFDLRFLHSGVAHARSRAWAKLGALVATALAAGGAWLAYEFGPWRPSAGDYRTLADRAAAEERFDDALRLLDEARNARETPGEKCETAMFIDRVKRWKDVSERWCAATNALVSGSLREARGILDSLPPEGGNWDWNATSARETFADAAFARGFMRRLTEVSDAAAAMSRDSALAQKAASFMKETEEYLASNGKALSMRPWLARCAALMRERMGRLAGIRDAIAKIDAELADAASGKPDFAKIGARLVEVAADTTAPDAARNHARSLAPLCAVFAKTQEFLRGEAAAISALRFADVERQAETLPLPPQDDCAKNPVFSDARAAFLARHRLCLKIAAHLKPMVANMESAGIREGSNGSAIEAVTDPAVWDRALSFDCFGRGFPRDNRAVPVGTYDELLGIEATYRRLDALPAKNPKDDMDLDNMKFVPKCNTARSAFVQVAAFVTAMERPEIAEFSSGGRLGRLYAAARGILAAKDSLVAMLKKKWADKNLAERARIVAGCYAEFFSDGSAYAYRDLRSVQSAFVKLRDAVIRLDEAYDLEPSPEKRIAIRSEILGKGIPGMPAVRKRWVELEY